MTVILSGLIVWSQIELWGDRRVFHIYELYQSNMRSQDENASLRERNLALEQEIINMRSGTESVEREAREELDMIRRGETFYRFTDDAFQQVPNQ